MKMVKTANGIKKIDDWNPDLIPGQLKPILQQHRATLVNKLIHGGLATYIDYKFSSKATAGQLEKIRNSLDLLKNDGIDPVLYHPMIQAVLNNDFTTLDNALFYREIDATISARLLRQHTFEKGQHFFFQQ
ncbi:hypothetical protein [Dawidia soli]|uniref:Uncharacterized protein n=1 Tax=Dawidia soli TaxID=2782352 RepID=A0AAP2GGS4_9BACT|nr:hypothetical protein [Dawidia soli]MBT1685820.1 hypothetical protein [Dawidia soli]